MASKRKFGVTSVLTGLSEGLVVNSINHSSTTETAEARNEHGQIIDIAGYGGGEEITIDGLMTTDGNGVKAGDVITIGDRNYLVTSTSNNESNTAFETANVQARWSPDCELWPLSAATSGISSGTINSGAN